MGEQQAVASDQGRRQGSAVTGFYVALYHGSEAIQELGNEAMTPGLHPCQGEE
jgi:hypothetical protein